MSRVLAGESVGLRERYKFIQTQLGSAQKGRGRGAPAYSIYVNRPLGRRLAAGAHMAGLSPNIVSFISAIFTFGAIATIAVVPPTVASGLVIALLLVIGYAFDSADGQVARLRGGGTAAGEWLDHVLDCMKCSTLHLAVLISMYVNFDLGSQLLLLVPIGFSIVSAVAFFAAILNDQLKSRYIVPAVGVGSKPSTPWRSLMGLPTDYGLLCVSFVIFGWTNLFFIVYVALFLANLGYLALASVKWFGDMKQLK